MDDRYQNFEIGIIITTDPLIISNTLLKNANIPKWK